MKRNKGFTLIELLVVIAIIGILSSVVLTSLSTARNRARVAKFQTEMGMLRASAEAFSANHGGSYASFTTGGVTSIISAISDSPDLYTSLNTTAANGTGTASNPNLFGGSTATAYAIYAVIPGGADVPTPPIAETWCIDSTGNSGPVSAVATNQFAVATQVTTCW